MHQFEKKSDRWYRDGHQHVDQNPNRNHATQYVQQGRLRKPSFHVSCSCSWLDIVTSMLEEGTLQGEG